MLLSHPLGLTQARAAILVLLVGLAAILGALAFQHLGGLAPCPLCLRQRLPYYAGIPLAALATVLMARDAPASLVRLLLLAIGLLFLYGAGLGIYHAGVEWHFWAGPTDCAAGAGAAPSSAGDLLAAMRETRVVPCDEAAWRFLGLSLAGYNAIIAGALGFVALRAAFRRDAAGA